MNNRDKAKWYVLYARSAAQKKEWTEAFQKEREKVKNDQEKGTSIVWIHLIVPYTWSEFFFREGVGGLFVW